MNVQALIDEYKGEVDKALFPFVSWKYMRETLSSTYGVVGVVPPHMLSWNLLLHSLQTTYIVSIGRIFDRDPESYTVDQFLKKCKAQINEFSVTAFEQRRITREGTRPNYLDQMVATATPPTEADFDVLIGYAAEAATLAKPFKTIRNKRVAHIDFKHIYKDEKLYGNASLADFDKVLEMLDKILAVVERAYHDCQWVDVRTQKRDREHHMLKDVKPFLAPLFIPKH